MQAVTSNAASVAFRNNAKQGKARQSKAPAARRGATPVRAVAPSSSEVKSSEADFAKYIKKKNAAIEKALSDSVPMMYPERLHESMRYSLLAGGKRIRPCLCVAAWQGPLARSTPPRRTLTGLRLLNVPR